MEKKIYDSIIKAIIEVNGKMFKDLYSRLDKIDALLLEIKEVLDEEEINKEFERNHWDEVENKLVEDIKILKEG